MLWVKSSVLPYSNNYRNDNLSVYKQLIYDLIQSISVIVFLVTALLSVFFNRLDFFLIGLYALSEGMSWISLEFSKLMVQDRQFVLQNVLRSLLLVLLILGSALFIKHEPLTIISIFIFSNLIPSFYLIFKNHRVKLTLLRFKSYSNSYSYFIGLKSFFKHHFYTFSFRSLLDRGDRYFINYLYGSELTGIYSIIVDITRRVAMIVGMSMNSYFYPRLTKLFVKETMNEYFKLLKNYLKVNIVVYSLFLITCIGMLLIGMVFHLNFKGINLDVYNILVILLSTISSIVFSFAIYYNDSIIYLNSRTAIWIPTYALSVAINLILNFILIRHFSYFGASFSYLTAVISLVVYQYRSINKKS